jgi:hypothetical protein
MPQLAFAGGQSATDFAQRLCAAQMAEQHGYKLAPTRETASMPFSAVFYNGLFKHGAGKQLQHLAENAGYSCHGGGVLPMVHVFSTQTVAEFYRRPLKS